MITHLESAGGGEGAASSAAIGSSVTQISGVAKKRNHRVITACPVGFFGTKDNLSFPIRFLHVLCAP